MKHVLKCMMNLSVALQDKKKKSPAVPAICWFKVALLKKLLNIFSAFCSPLDAPTPWETMQLGMFPYVWETPVNMAALSWLARRES